MIDSSSGEEDVFSISDEEGVPAAAIQVPVLGYVPVTNINPPSGYDIPFHIQEYDNNKHSLIVNALKRKRNEETTSNKTIQNTTNCSSPKRRKYTLTKKYKSIPMVLHLHSLSDFNQQQERTTDTSKTDTASLPVSSLSTLSTPASSITVSLPLPTPTSTTVNFLNPLSSGNAEWIENLAFAMSNVDYGIVCRDRRHNSMFYDCFIGSQAIDWLCGGVKGLGSNRERAGSIMNVMMREGYIRHVLNDSRIEYIRHVLNDSRIKLFQDKYIFYVFTEKSSKQLKAKKQVLEVEKKKLANRNKHLLASPPSNALDKDISTVTSASSTETTQHATSTVASVDHRAWSRHVASVPPVSHSFVKKYPSHACVNNTASTYLIAASLVSPGIIGS